MTLTTIKLPIPEEFTLTKETKKLVGRYYSKVKWSDPKNQREHTLAEIEDSNNLLIIATKNLIVIDFDTDDSFEKALAFNSTLAPQYQCNYIVKSTNKGGHFYYASSNSDGDNNSIQFPLNHTKQAVLDILAGAKHNVFANTRANETKQRIVPKTLSPDHELTQYNEAINTYVSLVVYQALPHQARQQQVLVDQSQHYSDDAIEFVKAYLSNLVTQEQFNTFYNIPDPIPQGQSNEYYKQLSTRLGHDETVSPDDYVSAMERFNQYHQRKTPEELHSEHLRRMLSNDSGQWHYDPKKTLNTLVLTHRYFFTKIEVYYDTITQEYLISYLDKQHIQQLIVCRTPTHYLELLEKITNSKRDQLRRATSKIKAVQTITDYSKPYGYDHTVHTFNKAIKNQNLIAFYGERPQTYETPTRFLEFLEYMWGEEYEYMLGMMKYRYSTFEFSPVVTYLKGTEGSGKDLSIKIASAGFNELPQNIDYSLLTDKHSNWQTQPNAVFSEIGSWRSVEQAAVLERLKTISGSNGLVTYRGMQQVATVVQSLIKIWVTGNEWVKLHTDVTTQRRIHIVYMPRPLLSVMGGPYTSNDIDQLMSPAQLLDFYYWLGNECTFSISPEDYNSPQSRQKTNAYSIYLEETQNRSDKAATLLDTREYNKYVEMLKLYQLTPEDIEYKYTRRGYAINVNDLKEHTDAIVGKIADKLAELHHGSKRIQFAHAKTRYIVLLHAPKEIEEVDGDDINLS